MEAIEKANMASKDGPLHDEADDQGGRRTVKECPECGETYTGDVAAHAHKNGIRKALPPKMPYPSPNSIVAAKFNSQQGTADMNDHMNLERVAQEKRTWTKQPGIRGQIQKSTHCEKCMGDKTLMKCETCGCHDAQNAHVEEANAGVKNIGIRSTIKTNPAAVKQIKDARANKMGVMKSGTIRDFIKALVGIGLPPTADKPFDVDKTEHFHENGCGRSIGPRGGVHTSNMVMWRRNGATKKWKTRPGHFSIPIKHGMYGPYGYLTQENQHRFHAHDDCPTFKETATP